MNLSTMTRSELEKLRADVQNELDRMSRLDDEFSGYAPAPAPAPRGDLATPKQVDFMAVLLRDRDLTGTKYSPFAGQTAPVQLTRQQASEAIDELTKLPFKPKPAPPTAAPVKELEDGIYVTDRGYLKVIHAVHGSGRQYGKVWNATDQAWERAGWALREARENGRPVTQEEAAAFGRLYGSCMMCGRTLTDEESIAAGIGPVCAGKAGW